jgi:hypothetical protein
MNMTTVRRILLLALMAGRVCCLVDVAHAQPITESALKQLTQQLDSAGFRSLATPTARLTVGGLVIPGHETAGTALRDVMLDALQPWRETSKTISLGDGVTLGTVAQIAKSLVSTDQHLFDEFESCRGEIVRLRSLAVTALSSDARKSADAPDVLTLVAQKVDAQREALDGAVVVWAVANGDAIVPGCQAYGMRAPLERQLSKLAWGYKAGMPADLRGATGSKPPLDILKVFDLNNLAKDRNVRIKGIETTPSGSSVAFLGRLHALGRNPELLPDEEYVHLGEAPTGPVDLWAGRFYLRVINGTQKKTLIRDVALADRDKILRLTLPPAGVR